ncbi:MAG TPA: 50S ribosomal protein L18 [Candidatus Eisenbacteria bacterium]|jgi:large subunit ribosomal protein L18|nr:50S ribosomal protein L18 [Candidatus Eisenbacteria bacterium]
MKSKATPRYEGRHRRHLRIRKKVQGSAERPRLTVYRSLNHIYAQLVDDLAGHTLLSVSSRDESLVADVKGAKGKVAAGKLVGKALAARAKEKGIVAVCFDRGGYLYHGRVKAVAEGAREGGLTF